MGIRRVILLAAALAAAVPSFAEDIDPEKHAEIVKLVNATGGIQRAEQMNALFIGTIMKAISSANPNVPPKVAAIVAEEVTAVIHDNAQAFTELAVQSIARHFSLAEIREINAFYATDVGKKMLAVMPDLSRESLAAGMKWGQALQPQLLERLRERFRKEGLDLPKSLS